MLKAVAKLVFKASVAHIKKPNPVGQRQTVLNFPLNRSVGSSVTSQTQFSPIGVSFVVVGTGESIWQTSKMHQTKMSQFFKKAVGGTAAEGASDVGSLKKKKKEDDEDEKEEEVRSSTKGRKRKSEQSVSPEDDKRKKKSAKTVIKVKLTRMRQEVSPKKEEDDEEEEEEVEDTKGKGRKSRRSATPLQDKGKKKGGKKYGWGKGDEESDESSGEEEAKDDEEEVKETKKERRKSKQSFSPTDDKRKKNGQKSVERKAPKGSDDSSVEEDSEEEKAEVKSTKGRKKNGQKSVERKARKGSDDSSVEEKSEEEKVKERKKQRSSSSDDDNKKTKTGNKAANVVSEKASDKEDDDDEGEESEEEVKDTKKVEKASAWSTSPVKKSQKKGAAKEKLFLKSDAKYDPIEDALWKRGEKVPYLALAKTLEAIEATSSRLKFIEILANYFRSVIVLSPNDLLPSVYLCLNKLAPAYEGIELGVAETNVMKAIAQATGRALDKIKADAGRLGDLGLVAESSRSNQKTLFQPQPLTVSGVFQKLKEIAAMTGQASHGKKISMITSLLVACKFSEARYLTRSLLGKLRIGLAEQSLLQALSQATYLTPPDQDMSVWPPKILNAGKNKSADSLKAAIEEHAFIMKSCFCECPNYDILVKAMIEVGINGLEERCKLTPGVPPRPMLAQPTKGVADVLQRFEGIRFTCEYKYDGERAQIHLSEDGVINIYSRNQENNTSKYPDVISRFSQCVKGDVKSCIIDAEAVAWDLEKGGILPFQVLSTRKRKDAKEAEIKVQVCIFAFDLIYLNGKSMVKEPLIKRRELLRENFQFVDGQFLFATSIDTDSMEEVQEFLEESLKGNCEGLMVKTLDERATYELAKRSQKWLKLKKDYLDKGGDSLDLVVIGGFLGKGKRTGTYGGFLLACYDPDEEAFQTICKIGTGFSDEQLQQHSEYLKPHVIPNAKSYYRFDTQLTPDHWFDAVQVWEVKCADLSLSPVHKAGEGLVDAERGISLRFPRFLRIRDDKNVEDATSSSQVADMYKNQEQVKNMNGGGAGDEDEFY